MIGGVGGIKSRVAPHPAITRAVPGISPPTRCSERGPARPSGWSVSLQTVTFMADITNIHIADPYRDANRPVLHGSSAEAGCTWPQQLPAKRSMAAPIRPVAPRRRLLPPGPAITSAEARVWRKVLLSARTGPKAAHRRLIAAPVLDTSSAAHRALSVSSGWAQQYGPPPADLVP